MPIIPLARVVSGPQQSHFIPIGRGSSTGDVADSGGAGAGLSGEGGADDGVVDEALGGDAPASAGGTAQVADEGGRGDVEDAQPDGHAALGAVVEEGGGQEVAVLGPGAADPAHDLNAVALVALLHGEEEGGLARAEDFAGSGEVALGEAREEGLEDLACAVEGSSQERAPRLPRRAR